MARKESGIKIDTLEDAKKVKRIGTLREDTRERFLKEHGFTNLESVSDEQEHRASVAQVLDISDGKISRVVLFFDTGPFA